MITVHTCTECGGGFTDHPRRGKCHMCYERARLAGQIPGLVNAAGAREHIAVLVGAGWKYNEIARAARIDRSLIAFIVNGRERINADTAFHICCVDPLGLAAHKAPPETPEHAKARGRKAADVQTPEQRRARGLKAWETRRANAAAKAAAQAAQEAEVAAQRERFEARRRAQVSDDGHLQKCNVCGNRTVWHRRGMCGRCYEARRNTGGLEWLTVALAPPGPWVDLALCAQIDGDLFFPEKGGSTRDAKKMCLSCEVREECLQYALENEERFGIWGGKSERERRRILKESQPAVAAHTQESA